MPSKAERVLGSLQRRVGGEVKISQRGVPHLVVQNLSACYFGKNKLVRVFTNYGQFIEPQEKFDFKEWTEAASFIEDKLGIKGDQHGL
jgi:hypothetical protein